MNLRELKESLSYDITVNEVDRWIDYADPEDMMSEDVGNIEYDVYINGTQVGNLVYDSYYGQLQGNLSARNVKLQLLNAGAEATVKSYLLKTPTGRKHMQLIIRQMGL